ncbi:hypothetical protein F5J12DRAFT_893277 [Pisolithus orientalis]|uniref:uncharacterized protein n=1 Tax=Pisolithus orientalis TaxID=936130 RepID=UPI0022252A78|nr:uncharacterized protein F5J12DRAFT_893277 [Pisolithus orientalis]KAI6005204.1 hypothetical protein F5J12DRAFT_893277 [Pisolithus orientalis]
MPHSIKLRLSLATPPQKKELKKPAGHGRTVTPCTPLNGVEDKSKKENRVTNRWKKHGILVLWKKQPQLTDELLTLVKSNMKWMVAFGFDKSSASNKPGTPFGPADLKKLTEAVKNHISSLHTTYNDYFKQLGETGHGLIVSDHEHEITPVSEITNAYDLIKVKFLWYQWMHELSGTSPIASHVAISNSTSSLDLPVLDRFENDADVFDEGGDITESAPHDSSPLNNSHLGSPGFDTEWPPSKGEVTAPLSIPEPKVKLTVKHPASPCTDHSSVKRKKTPQELACEIVEGEHAAQLQMSLNSAKEMTGWGHIKREAA